MTGVAQQGSMFQLNSVTGVAAPLVQTSTPATGVLGQYWVNASDASIVQTWNGTTWVAVGGPYVALLTADPTGSTTISQLGECTDGGYSRQAVDWNSATSGTPVSIENSELITFGPFSVNMALPCQWLALVSIPSGTTGLLLETFTLSSPQQVLATQSITLAPQALTITDS
jgi:hypothetical protein